MPTIVIASADAGGNVPPTIGVARELDRRGWQVLVHGDESMRERVEAAALTFVPALSRQLDPLRPRRSPAAVLDLLQVLGDPERANEVLALIARVGADVALVDIALLRVIDTCTGTVPTAVLCPTSWEYFGRLFGPPYGPVLQALGLPAQRIMAAVDRVLVASPAVLDPVPMLPPNAVRIGAVPQDPPGTPERSTDPLVLVSLSSVWLPRQARVLQRITDAVAALPARVLVTTGRSVAPSDLRPPPGVEVHGLLDHGQVLPRASLVIGHGGHGTTVRTLAHDVPMVVVPLNPSSDQARVGRAAARTGAALVVPRTASVGRLRAAAATVLQHSGFAAAAARAGAAIRARDGAAEAAEALAELAERR